MDLQCEHEPKGSFPPRRIEFGCYYSGGQARTTKRGEDFTGKVFTPKPRLATESPFCCTERATHPGTGRARQAGGTAGPFCIQSIGKLFDMGFVRRRWKTLLLVALLGPYLALQAYRANQYAISAWVESRPALRDLRNQLRFWPPPEESLSCELGPPSPIARFESPGAVIDGKLYVFGGFTFPGLTASSRCDVFDPETAAWKRIADLPAPLTHAAVVQDDRSVWFLGGFVGDHPGLATNAVWRYDADADSWHEGPALPALRASGGAAILGRSLHYFGGSEVDRVTDSGDHWTLDLEAADPVWRFAPPMPGARHHLSAVVLNGKIHAMGGQIQHDALGDDRARTDVFDPAAGQWITGPSLPRPKAHFEPGTFFVNQQLCVAGGESGLLQALYDFQCLDAEAGRWREYPALPTQLRAPLVRQLGDRIVIVAGGGMPSGMEPGNQTWLCDPPAGPLGE